MKPHIITLWGASLLSAAALAGGCRSADYSAPASTLPQLGLQAYTFRAVSFAETVEKARALGIRYLQAYPTQRLEPGSDVKFHHTMEVADRDRALELARANGVSIVSYGVVRAKDEVEWRQVFAFARAVGMQDIAVEPPQEMLPLLDRLSRESGVAVSLHNHPAPSRYYDPDVALAAVQPYGPNMGVCADTGHWVRSGFDPIDCLRKAEGRILSLHFKDLTERGEPKAHDVPWGTGASNAAGQVEELLRQGFSGVVFVEYEHQSPSLEAEIARSAAFFRQAIADPTSAHER